MRTKPEILLAIISNASTPKRLSQFEDVLMEAERWGAIADRFVVANSKEVNELAFKRLHAEPGRLIIRSYDDGNRGQHVAFNDALKHAKSYKYLVRIDDDVRFTSRTWLTGLLAVSSAFEDRAIVSAVPRHWKVDDTKWKDTYSKQTEVGGHKVIFSSNGLGGLCRLHPMSVHEKCPYVSDVRLPKGSGDPTSLARWALMRNVPMIMAMDIVVKHADTKDEEDEVYGKERQMNSVLPYIPQESVNG